MQKISKIKRIVWNIVVPNKGLVIAILFLLITIIVLSNFLINTSSSNLVTDNIQNKSPNSTPTFPPEPTKAAKIIIPTPLPTQDVFEGLENDYFYITFYGWPDNTPSGKEISYPKNKFPNSYHNEAGGLGTYSNPVTFASDPDNIPVGKIFYVPYIEKYIVMEDFCTGCSQNWDNGRGHIDIWMESGPNFSEELLECQKNWTKRSELVITNPTPNLPVNTTPLFNENTGECKSS